MCVKTLYHGYNFSSKLFENKGLDQGSSGNRKPFTNHLWNLEPETAAFLFFDDDVPVYINRKNGCYSRTD